MNVSVVLTVKKKVGVAEHSWLYLHTAGYVNKRYKVDRNRRVAVAAAAAAPGVVVVVVTIRCLSSA
jgi:hypothetical protein